MNNFDEEMLAKVDGEIRRLQGIRSMLVGGAIAAPTRRVSVTVKQRGQRGRRAAQPTRTGRIMSAEGRRKRSEAQKARWARVKAAGNTPAPQEIDSHKATSSNAATPNKAVS